MVVGQPFQETLALIHLGVAEKAAVSVLRRYRLHPPCHAWCASHPTVARTSRMALCNSFSSLPRVSASALVIHLDMHPGFGPSPHGPVRRQHPGV